MKNSGLKKALSIVGNILLYLFLAICVLAVVLTVFSKKGPDGAAELFGHQMRIVTSDSMAECELTDVSGYEIKSIPIRSMVFVQVMPQDEQAANEWYANIKVGDVLTFRYVYTTQVTITHRVTAITEKDSGGYIIELEGDNKNSDSNLLTQTIDTSVPNNTNYVIGKVVGQSVLLGNLLSLLKTPLGIILIIIVPCFIIILLEVLKIVGAFSAERKKREQEQAEQKDNELEELRRKLAALETLQTEGNASPSPDIKESTVLSPDTNTTATELANQPTTSQPEETEGDDPESKKEDPNA